MRTELTIEDRLKMIAETMFPIEEGMCAFRRQGVLNKRIGFVWQMSKQFKGLSEAAINIVLNELETKTAIQP